MTSLFGSTTSTSITNQELKNDIEVIQPPEDSISGVSFSPQAEFLAVSSWKVQSSGQTTGKAMYEHQGHVLSCCWSKDGTKIASVGTDKAGMLFDLHTGQSIQVAAHDLPIKSCRFIDGGNMGNILATGSWDKMLKYWDLRQQQPIATVQLPERCYTMDVMNQLMVIGTADRHVCIIHLNNPTTIFKTTQSPLKFQTRVISCFIKANGYAIGSGRLFTCLNQEKRSNTSSLNFSFRCHRDSTGLANNSSNVYSVNDISFHPQHGTFATAGSDGTFHFWDKDSKHRLKGFANVGGTISCTAFNRTGDIFAYAISYDWSKGYQANTPQTLNKIMLHPVGVDELKPRAKKTTR
ncbi:hypothetical protein T552_01068 [Pneumocystis carinii B80]|uniref:Anaphase-promoting complex subunit 4 WD40 domain-containing protein n=1 Tax=Pneumocystis carinii (strain B80) TaxID=1408658 RepID=A0A0W4ZN99_PNEC8|nr:hypothetical protein T552_01068 [Pneumocystis carinii B80]KTW29864.1 hypothetical protein T552_01068 [Pneumocystis carinii B80]